MKTKGILLIAFLALLLHDVNCAKLETAKNVQTKSAADLSAYKLERIIGKGTYGEVKLATRLEDRKEVAIKMIDKAKLYDTEIQDVHQEAEIMGNLSHPHIIEFLQFIEMKKKLCIVTEFAIGGDMEKYLHKQNNPEMTEPEVRIKMKQIVDAVEYLHDHKIAHRDLKPANLLLDKKGKEANIKLADFGYATYFVPGEKLDRVCGSPGYMAPEIHNGKKYYGTKVDVWALGCILYEFLTEDELFYAKSEDLLKFKVLHKNISAGTFQEVDDISTDGADLLCKMLDRNPKERFTIQQVKSHKWMQIPVK